MLYLLIYFFPLDRKRNIFFFFLIFLIIPCILPWNFHKRFLSIPIKNTFTITMGASFAYEIGVSYAKIIVGASGFNSLIVALYHSSILTCVTRDIMISISNRTCILFSSNETDRNVVSKKNCTRVYLALEVKF